MTKAGFRRLLANIQNALLVQAARAREALGRTPAARRVMPNPYWVLSQIEMNAP